MACGSCRGNRNRHSSNGKKGLRQYAFLTPKQLRLLKQIEGEEKDSKPEETK